MADRTPNATPADLARMEGPGGLLWWKHQFQAEPFPRPITVEDVYNLIADLWGRTHADDTTTLFMSVETAEAWDRMRKRYMRRLHRRRRKQQKRAIGRHRW